MFGFYILLAIIFTGFGAIVFIFLNEKKKESPPDDEKKTAAPQLEPGDVLGRLGIETPKVTTVLNPKLALPPIFNKPTPEQGTASLKIDPSVSASPVISKSESELVLKYDELMTEHKELQGKYETLDKLFNEKSNGLEQSEKTLINELKNQKEFNKVKDILEKELKETKDKNRISQADTVTAKTEIDNQLKKVAQLEEKIKKLEISALSAKAAINDAQADTQLARKKVLELEEKIREKESQILDKNQKIKDLVGRLNKDLPTIFPSNTLPPPPPDLGAPVPDSEPILPPSPTPPLAMNVDEKGGAETSAPATVENRGEAAATTSEEASPAKETPLALPPDIFADKSVSTPKNPAPPPSEKAP